MKSALQLVNETMCIAAKSGEREWAVEVCRNGGGTAYTEIDAVGTLSMVYKRHLITRDRNDHRPGRLGDFKNLVDSRIMVVLAIKSRQVGRELARQLGNQQGRLSNSGRLHGRCEP